MKSVSRGSVGSTPPIRLGAEIRLLTQFVMNVTLLSMLFVDARFVPPVRAANLAANDESYTERTCADVALHCLLPLCP